MKPELIVFDLDGTLAQSKSAVTASMAETFCKLLDVAKAAVISGGAFPQFDKQFLSHLVCPPESLSNLFILPASGTQLWTFDTVTKTWKEQYENDFSQDEDNEIRETLERVCKEYLPTPEQTYGELIEDRGSQITFSALGQAAPVDAKKDWDPDQAKRRMLQGKLQPLLPEFEIRIGGMTSIDITKKGYDKAYGLQKLSEYAQIAISSMIYVGDALFEGGNDAVVKKTGVKTQQVSGPEETEEIIHKIIGGLL